MELSQKQLNRITYEAMLLKVSPQQLMVLAPHLFIEGVTSTNKLVEEEKPNSDTVVDTGSDLPWNAPEVNEEEDDTTYEQYYLGW